MRQSLRSDLSDTARKHASRAPRCDFGAPHRMDAPGTPVVGGVRAKLVLTRRDTAGEPAISKNKPMISRLFFLIGQRHRGPRRRSAAPRRAATGASVATAAVCGGPTAAAAVAAAPACDAAAADRAADGGCSSPPTLRRVTPPCRGAHGDGRGCQGRGRPCRRVTVRGRSGGVALSECSWAGRNPTAVAAHVRGGGGDVGLRGSVRKGERRKVWQPPRGTAAFGAVVAKLSGRDCAWVGGGF